MSSTENKGSKKRNTENPGLFSSGFSFRWRTGFRKRIQPDLEWEQTFWREVCMESLSVSGGTAGPRLFLYIINQREIPANFKFVYGFV